MAFNNVSANVISNFTNKTSTSTSHHLLCDDCETSDLIPDYYSFCIFAIGFIGNMITIIKIATDERLQRPVYVLLQCLAVADLTSLLVKYLLNSTMISKLICGCLKFLQVDLYDSLLYLTQHNSAFHIVFLTGYRLLLVVRPIHGRHVITIGKVRLVSALIWLASAIVAAVFAVSKILITGDDKFDLPGTYITIFRRRAYDKRSDIEVAYIAYTMLVAVLVLVFHIIKLRTADKMRGSRTSRYTDSFISLSKSTRRRMTLIVTVIIVFYMAACVFELIYFCLYRYRDRIDPYLPDKFLTAATYSWLVNYAANPLIYFFFSKTATEILCYKCA